MTLRINRRLFLGMGILVPLSTCLPLYASTMKSYDVIVAGSGAGGLTAAIRAAENGAKVLVLEANSWIGGASRVATGIFGCAGHPIQQKLGITTTPEDLYQLYISEAAATKTKADPKVARILADGAIPAADWLQSLGVEWSTKKAQKFFLNIKEGYRLGQLLIPALEKRAVELGVTIKTNSRVEKILTTDGKVSGVEVLAGDRKETYKAPAVILATGGFEANPEMIKQYIGKDWEQAKFYCTPTNRGDGQRMAEAIGANLADMEVFKANPTVHYSNGNKWNLISAVQQGAIAVNGKGKRFMNETGGYYQSLNEWAQPERSSMLVFGEPLLSTNKRLQQLKDELVEADSPEELAKKLGINPQALKETIEEYRSAVKAGKDENFGRGSLKDPFGGKFYAIKIEPMMQGTFGGVQTNEKTEALKKDGSVIPGLFAIGECAAAGLRGVNPQTANIVFGSIAGRQASRYAGK